EGPSFYDEARWILDAKTIALGMGFIDIAIPGNPSESLVQYSPGFPIIIALLFHMLGAENLLLIKSIPIISSIGLIITTYTLMRTLFGKRIGLISALFVSFQYQLFVFSHLLQPEIILSFLLVLLVYITFSWAETKKFKFLLIAIPICITLVVVRVVGFIIIPLLFIYILLKGSNWNERIFTNVFLYVGILSFLVIITREYLLTGSFLGTYVRELFYYNPHDWRGGAVSITDTEFIIARTVSGILFYLLSIPSVVLFEVIPQMSIRLLLGFFIIGLGIILGIKRKRNEVIFLCLFIALYIIFFSWWYFKQIRYILPLSPFLLSFCAISFAKIADWVTTSLRTKKPSFGKFNKKNMALIISAIIFLGFIMPDAVRAVIHVEKDRTQPLSTVQEKTIEAYQWVRDNTPSDAIITSRNPHRAFYFSERKGVFLQFALEKKDQIEFMRDWGVSYIVIEDTPEIRQAYYWLFDPNNVPKEFRLVYYAEVPLDSQKPFIIAVYSFK
ncbi:MAG: glycosyltransferase family 39 protein, partial [Candidatus Lokiarchaeota archaeon]|nr:glycosyltransferase family 39 protein [Candidatus Lokiarchaeota archaeon]